MVNERFDTNLGKITGLTSQRFSSILKKVETVYLQFRKVTKNRALLPNDGALTKMLYLAYRVLSKKWSIPIQNWALILSNFSVYFKVRFDDF